MAQIFDKNFKMLQSEIGKSNQETVDLRRNLENDIKIGDVLQKEIKNKYSQKKEFYNNFFSFFDNDDKIDENFIIFNDWYQNQEFGKNRQDLVYILKLVSNILINYHRSSTFYEKINKILKYFQKDIKIFFSNSELIKLFKNNKFFLLYLMKNQIITFDESFKNLLIMEDIDYVYYFYPEIKSYLDSNEQKEIENELLKIDPNILDNYEEKRLKGESDTFLCELIRNDSIESFIIYINQNTISPSSFIQLTFFETNSFLLKNKTLELIKYAAFFGSIQIFQYLIMNGVKLMPSIWPYMIHSRNAEMINYLVENDIQMDDRYCECFVDAIKCNYPEIADYLQNKFCDVKINIEIVNNSDGYDCLINYMQQYDYFPIVDFLLNTIKISARCNNFEVVDYALSLNRIETELKLFEPKKNHIEIPNSITIIGKNSFELTRITEIVIPSSVKEIHEYAFYNCKSLKNVIFAKDSDLTLIERSAFEGCSSLEHIEIPSKVFGIGESCFNNCTSLKNVKLPSSLMEIGARCFCNCSSIEKISIPISVNEICNSTFCGCEKLKEIGFPPSLTYIGRAVFYRCTSLEEIRIPYSVTEIGFNAFGGCFSLKKIVVSSTTKFNIANDENLKIVKI